MLILNSAASLKYAEDTWHGTTLIHILKRGQPALALPNKSASGTPSNLWPPVPGSRGYTEGDKKRYARVTLIREINLISRNQLSFAKSTYKNIILNN